MTEVRKILLVDDHQMFIDGLKALLEGQDKFQVFAEATNGGDALKILDDVQVDFMITDLSMPQMSGIDLVRTVKELYPHLKVLVLSMHNNRETVTEVLMSEAEGYILKNTGKPELLSALERIDGGSTYYSHEVMSIMFERVRQDKRREEATKGLTERELEVLQLITEEYSSEEIAQKLFISRRTVETHRKHISEKTGVKTIVGLIKFAFQHGLIDLKNKEP